MSVSWLTLDTILRRSGLKVKMFPRQAEAKLKTEIKKVVSRQLAVGGRT